jgi:HD-GYP domain-containing protein (c-di-GMP phosphodiesterase class II)
MTSPRPYRPTPLSVEAALAELHGAAGTQFDPTVVEAFCDALAKNPNADPQMAAAARSSR